MSIYKCILQGVANLGLQVYYWIYRVSIALQSSSYQPHLEDIFFGIIQAVRPWYIWKIGNTWIVNYCRLNQYIDIPVYICINTYIYITWYIYICVHTCMRLSNISIHISNISHTHRPLLFRVTSLFSGHDEEFRITNEALLLGWLDGGCYQHQILIFSFARDVLRISTSMTIAVCIYIYTYIYMFFQNSRDVSYSTDDQKQRVLEYLTSSSDSKTKDLTV